MRLRECDEFPIGNIYVFHFAENVVNESFFSFIPGNLLSGLDHAFSGMFNTLTTTFHCFFYTVEMFIQPVFIGK